MFVVVVCSQANENSAVDGDVFDCIFRVSQEDEVATHIQRSQMFGVQCGSQALCL